MLLFYLLQKTYLEFVHFFENFELPFRGNNDKE